MNATPNASRRWSGNEIFWCTFIWRLSVLIVSRFVIFVIWSNICLYYLKRTTPCKLFICSVQLYFHWTFWINYLSVVCWRRRCCNFRRRMNRIRQSQLIIRHVQKLAVTAQERISQGVRNVVIRGEFKDQNTLVVREEYLDLILADFNLKTYVYQVITCA
jgi:hypothetical protein